MLQLGFKPSRSGVLASTKLTKNTKRFRGTTPDAILKTAYIKDFKYVEFEAGIIVDAKAAIGGIIKYHQDRNPQQIPKYMDYLETLPNATRYGVAGIMFIVPYGTEFDDKLITQANERNIRLYKAETFRSSSDPSKVYVGNVQWINKDQIYVRDFGLKIGFDPLNWKLGNKPVNIGNYFNDRLDAY